MINNLSKYISSNSSIVPVTNGYDLNKSEGTVSLILTGGTQVGRVGTMIETVQVLTTSKSKPRAHTLAKSVFSLLANRFKLTLPEVTVKGVNYPAVVADAILAIQTPGYIGVDNDGYHQWSVNFSIVTGG